jgi:hypothetical protein
LKKNSSRRNKQAPQRVIIDKQAQQRAIGSMGNRLNRGVFVMKRARIRLFLVACAVLLVGIGAINVRQIAAQDDPGLLEINAVLCSDADTAPESCTTPADNLTLTALVGALEAEPETLVTDAGGFVGYELNPARFSVRFDVEFPEGYSAFSASCRTADGSDISLWTSRDAFALQDQFPEGDITCTLYFFETSDVPTPLYTFGVVVSQCSELPEGGPYYASPLCHTPDGVRIVYLTRSGEEYASCITGADTGCSLGIPYGESMTVELDESTIPDGYYLYGTDNPQVFIAPTEDPDGIYGGPFFMLLPVDAEVPGDVPEDLEDEANPPAVATEGTDEPTVEGRTVALYAGDCDNIGEEVAILNDVLPEDGDIVGDENAIPAEMSVTNGALFFLDAAIDEGMALVVYKDDTTDTPVACGELGGVNTHDGMLPIGLGEIDDSGIVGTAVLSYNADDESTTDVTIVISAELLPKPTATAGA